MRPHNVGVKTIVEQQTFYSYPQRGWVRNIRVRQYLLRPTKGFKKAGPSKMLEQFKAGDHCPKGWTNRTTEQLVMTGKPQPPMPTIRRDYSSTATVSPTVSFVRPHRTSTATADL